MDGKSHSTGLCPLLGPLPKKTKQISHRPIIIIVVVVHVVMVFVVVDQVLTVIDFAEDFSKSKGLINER